MTDVVSRIRALYAEGRYAETVDYIRMATEFSGPLGSQWKLVVNAANTMCDRFAAARAAERWLDEEPDSFEALEYAMKARAWAADIDGALALGRRMIELYPSVAHAWYYPAEFIAQSGDIETALAWYRRTLELDPNFIAAWEYISRLKRFEPSDLDLPVIETLVKKSEPLGPPFLIAAHYTCANAYDSLGDYDRAFPHYEAAMRYVRGTSEFSYERYSAPMRQGLAAFTKDFLSVHAGGGAPSRQPIFVVGPPRSGTTLVEQILAAHPKVKGAGEALALRVAWWAFGEFEPENVARCVRKGSSVWGDVGRKYLQYTHELFGEAERLTNKDIGTIASLGLVKLALPNAKMVFVSRDPMDAGWSCVKAHFGPSAAWSFDFDLIARYYADYARAQDIWRERLPGELLDVRYEDLVSDPKPQTDRLLAFCGLEPDPACYSPHKTTRQITTASFVQVRRPISASSIGAWRKYERHLAPLKAAMERYGAA
jgi:tetratricopeptide (TPR) repeat protein